MCRTTFTYLPRCPPTPAGADNQTRSPALLENLGDLESWKGNPDKSSAYLDEALRLYQDQEDIKGVASILRKQAGAAYRISDVFKSRAIASTALEHCRALNNVLGIAEVSYYLGFSLHLLGDGDKALPILRESLDIRRTHGDDVGAVQCLESIGEIQRCNWQNHEALSTLGEAVEIASQSGDRLGLALVLHVMGNTHFDSSDFVQAASALLEAIMVSRSIGWEGGLSTTLRSMGRLKMHLGDYREAEEHFQESISPARHIGDRWRLAQGLEGLGSCLESQSRLDEAAPFLEEACLLWHELAQPWSSKQIAGTLVRLKSSQGDWYGALTWRDHIITVCRSQKLQLEVAEHLKQKAEILLERRRYDEAAVHFEAAMVTLWENNYLSSWQWGDIQTQLCAIPKTHMKWERRLPLLCDLQKLQRRQPQLITASLKLPIPIRRGE